MNCWTKVSVGLLACTYWCDNLDFKWSMTTKGWGVHSFIWSVLFNRYLLNALSVLCEWWGCNKHTISLPLRSFVSHVSFLFGSKFGFLVSAKKNVTSGEMMNPEMSPCPVCQWAESSDWDKRIRANKTAGAGFRNHRGKPDLVRPESGGQETS